jgi:hypothetical protein
MRIRVLLRWSAISLKKTAHSPVQGEPSRRGWRGLGCMAHLLEVAGIDLVEAGLLERKAKERGPGLERLPGHLGPDVLGGFQS